ncbi:MAG: hypothetical protein ABFD98_16200 [Syntrophobacteraceae bacterium]
MNQEKSTEPVQFQVVFEGKSKEGVDPEKAAEKLARTFRLPPESVQSLLSGRSEDAPGNPVTAALKPLAYAFVCLIFINLTAKPIALYFDRKASERNSPQSVSRTGKAVNDHWQKMVEVQKRQAEQMRALSGEESEPQYAPQAPGPVSPGFGASYRRLRIRVLCFSALTGAGHIREPRKGRPG